MRAYEFIKSRIPLVFGTQQLKLENAIEYFGRKLKINEDRFSHITWTKRFQTVVRYALKESQSSDIEQFFDRLSAFDSKKTIQVGDQFCVIEFECMFGFSEILVHGCMVPKTVDKISMNRNGTINYLHFEGEPELSHYPAYRPAVVGNKAVTYAFYFDNEEQCKQLLSFAMLSKPESWEIYLDDDISGDRIDEGGWANPITQNTTITPALVNRAWAIMKNFESQVNQYIESKGLPPVEIAGTAGSSTYYQRDLEKNPAKEYGDIDVNLLVPKLPDMTNNANFTTYQKLIKEFCDSSSDYQTQNGTNVIFRIGSDYVQVDLVMSFYESKEWIKALAPEWNVKGVLCNSLYSSLGEALNLSMGGGLGVQVKTINNVPVKFSTQKGVQLSTISLNPKTWAVDIAKYFGAKQLSQRLQAYPGLLDEVRTADIIQSIIGIAETLEMNGLLGASGLSYNSAEEVVNTVSNIYLGKIDKAINSSKFDKAETPAAIKKAADTKAMLAQKSQQIAAQFKL